MSGPDEADQATRAAAVARGHPFGASNSRHDQIVVFVEAPEAYLSAHEVGFCQSLDGRAHRSLFDESLIPDPAAGSCPEMSGSQDTAPVPTNEFRGQPVYYFLVGLPTLVASAATGAYLMRLAAVVLCSAFLASGLLSLTRLPQSRLAVLAGAAVLTPSVVYFVATVNPVGLEVATAFGAWAGLLALVRGRVGTAAETSRLVTRTGVALAMLVVTRPLSPAFAVVVLLVGGLVAPPGRVRELLGRRDVRRWLGVAAAGTVLSIAWVVDVRLTFPFRPLGGSGLDFALEQIPWWGREMVGIFGPTTVAPPVVVHLGWLAVVVGLVAVGWRAAERRHLLIAAVLGVGMVALMVAGEGFNVPPTNVWWQGRYVLPLAMACMLLPVLGGRSQPAPAAGPNGAAPLGGTNGHRVRRVPGLSLRAKPSPVGLGRLGPALLAVLVGLQLWCFTFALRHYLVGPEATANPFAFLFDAEWSPPLVPPWLYVVVLAGALGLLFRLLWKAATSASVTVTAADEPDDDPIRGPDEPLARMHLTSGATIAPRSAALS